MFRDTPKLGSRSRFQFERKNICDHDRDHSSMIADVFAHRLMEFSTTILFVVVFIVSGKSYKNHQRFDWKSFNVF